MKKRLLLLVFLSLCLVLSACGGNSPIYGEVVEATPAALVLETNEGKRVAVLLEENTYIWGTDDIDSDTYKTAPHTGVRVYFFPDSRAGSVAAADGTQIKAYRTGSHIKIDARLLPDAAALSDGTALDVWKSYDSLTYQIKDGVDLLLEEPPHGPDGHIVVNKEPFDDLNETAKAQIIEFYETQGALYDLQAELDRAHAAYQADPKTFSSFFVKQTSVLAASSEQVIYFITDLTQTVSGNRGQTITLCNAFDRDTGASIPVADLFICPEEDLGKELLDLAEKNGSGPADPVKAEMEAAFRMEYLNFSPDSLWVEFPQGSLPSQEYPYMVSVPFNDECKALMHSWAVPRQNN